MKQINYKSKNFTKTSSYNNSSIYKLKCGCNKCYIGKTNKNLITRYKKHISDIKL